jgi:hypothetical protein
MPLNEAGALTAQQRLHEERLRHWPCLMPLELASHELLDLGKEIHIKRERFRDAAGTAVTLTLFGN